MPVHDVGMVMLEELMHLLHLLRSEGLYHVHPVTAEIVVGPAPQRVDGARGLGQGVEEVRVVDSKPLPEVSEDQRTILFDFEVAGEVLLVVSVVLYCNFRKGSEVVRHQHDGDVDVLELPHGVVDTPHEDREEGVVTAEKFSLWMFHFKSFCFCFGETLHHGSLVHAVAGPAVQDSLKRFSSFIERYFAQILLSFGVK